MELTWIILHLNSTGDQIINACLSFASSWLFAVNKRPKALSKPNTPHTANKHAPELIPDEVSFTAIVRKLLSVVVISRAWDHQKWLLKPHCKPFQYWWLFPIKQNWGKGREANRRLGALEPIYLALFLSSEVITGENIGGKVSWFHIWLSGGNPQVGSSFCSRLPVYKGGQWMIRSAMQRVSSMCLFSL